MVSHLIVHSVLPSGCYITPFHEECSDGLRHLEQCYMNVILDIVLQVLFLVYLAVVANVISHVLFLVAVHPGAVQCIPLNIVSRGIISSRISDCHRIRSTYACFTAMIDERLLEDKKRVELIPHTAGKLGSVFKLSELEICGPSNVAHQQTQSWFQSNLISAVRRLHEVMGRFLN
ncbi:hypothetical protein T03_11958 [Trichinella britovi]|uniref:Uncharacterized protein n=1 Tax=Trichinella britovi TaxID=45882 RepID=A0A0V1CBR5_TRIBR|nr:hypothetical protein T03_11958 [Trichinella britovi]